MKKQKILFLTTANVFNPETGADNRCKNIYKHLSCFFETTLITFSKSGIPAPEKNVFLFNYPSRKFLVPIYPRYLYKMYKLIQKENYDYIFVSRIGAAIYGLFAKKLSKSKLIFDDHDVVYKLLLDQKKYLSSYLNKFFEKKICLKSDLVVTTSIIDQKILSKWILKDKIVLANGYDENYFFPRKNVPKKNILFFGNMRYNPNQEALQVIKRILIPNVNLKSDIIKIAGPDSLKFNKLFLKYKNVRILGTVKDIALEIQKSKLVIVPLKTGSGTRLKIIEALACGTKVLSTHKGAEGFPNNWDNLIITDIKNFPKIINYLIDKSYKFNGSEYHLIKKYSWRKQVNKLIRKMKRLK